MMFGSKQAKLKDGSVVTLRPMTEGDRQALQDFFNELPEELLVFVRHDVKDPKVIDEWARHLDYQRVIPLLAWAGDEIIADVTLHRIPHGWKRHIGKVRIVVSPKYQDQGLATLMLNELTALAAELGLEKLWAEIPLDSVGAVRAFRNAGFGCKAVIEGLVRDSHDRDVDILIMVCDVAGYFDKRWVKQWE